jgi:hypothetical protein
MKHTCDGSYIHTIAAKIVNHSYPIDAISVFWVIASGGMLRSR